MLLKALQLVWLLVLVLATVGLLVSGVLALDTEFHFVGAGLLFMLAAVMGFAAYHGFKRFGI